MMDKIQKLQKRSKIVAALADYLMDEKTFKELGEPLIYRPGAVYFVYLHKYTNCGFVALEPKGNYLFLRYFYVFEGMRGKGLFSKLHAATVAHAKESGIEYIKCTATEMALHLYLNKGWQIEKSFKNYHNLKLEL